MSVVARVLVAAAAAALAVRAAPDPVCTSDIYGVLNGTAHRLPEHYLMPHMFDWAIGVPLLCPGEVVVGMEARVCSWFSPPTVRIVDWGTALVHLRPWLPTYSTVNVTVYCAPSLPAPSSPPPPPMPPPASSPLPLTASAAGLSTEEHTLNRLMSAKPMRRSSSSLTPFWSRN